MFAFVKRTRVQRLRIHSNSWKWLVVGLCAMAPLVRAQAVDEYAIKAAFLFNFTKFVDIPQGSDASSFLICIVGDDPFGSSIDQVVKGKVANGHPIQVRRVKQFDEVRQCQVAFLGRNESSKASKVIAAAKGVPVLLVGEDREFAHMGGTIYFSVTDNHVGFVVNLAGAEHAGLKISAKLLSVAKIFDPKDDPDER